MRIHLFLISLIFLFPGVIQAESPRILSMSIYDEGQFGGGGGTSPSVDSVQDDCNDNPDEEDLEAFYDTVLGMTVLNTLRKEVVFRRFSYRLRYRDDDGRVRRIRIRKQGIAGNAVAPGYDTETEVLAFLFDERDGRKYFPGTDTVLPEDAGFSNLRVRLVGRTSDGHRVRVRAKMTVSIGNLDRC